MKRFLLIIVLLASTAYALPVYAQTVLYESYETGGEIDPASDIQPLIGVFEVQEPLFFDVAGGVYAGFHWKNESAFCNGSDAARYLVSSSTASAYPGGASLWETDQMIIGTNYEFQEETRNSAGTGVWIIPGHTYGIYLISNCSGTDWNVTADNANLIGYGYLSWDGNYGDVFAENGVLTRIISVTPANASTTATSTNFTLSADININEQDFSDDLFLRFRFVRRQNLQATGNAELYYTNIDIPIVSDGFHTISTTTSITEIGEYDYYVQIRSPSLVNQVLNWWGIGGLYDPGVLARSKTYFIAGEQTAFEMWLDQAASTTSAILGNPGELEANLDDCNPLAFSAIGCLTGLFLPNSAQMLAFIEELQVSVLSKAPVGYATRLITIITNTATTSLPVISYEFGENSPLEGETLSYNFTGILASAGEILNQDLVSDRDDPQSIWDIFMPIWEAIVYLTLFLIVLHDVTGVHKRLKT